MSIAKPPTAAASRRLKPPSHPTRYTPTPARPVRAKQRWLAPDTEIQPHRHAWGQVVIAVSGVARVTTEHGTYLVPAWRAVWIPPNMEHAVSVVEVAELRTLYVHLHHSLADTCRVLEVSPLLRELVLQLNLRMDLETDPETDPETDLETDQATGSEPPLSADALARERRLCDLALDELRRAAPVPLGVALPQDKRLRALCQAVIDDPTRHDTLDAWSAAAGASTRTVARLFRQQLGTSFGPWRQQVLLARALTLAAQGRSMGFIAGELGYASASAFTAMVRRSVGSPPGRFFGPAARSPSPLPLPNTTARPVLPSAT